MTGIYKLATLLDESDQIHRCVYDLFEKLDLNNDGKLNFHQFCNFAAQTTPLWVELYFFRVKLLNKLFPNESWRIILDRKRQITVIKDYQKVHNGKFPKQPCFIMMKNLLTGSPHLYRYDYGEDCNSHISFYEFTYDMIHLYKHDFKPVYRENFNLKCLGTFNFLPTIAEIDRYYLMFRNVSKIGSKANSRVSLSEARISAINSERSHHNSILKPSNYCINKVVGGNSFGKLDKSVNKSSKSCNFTSTLVRPRGHSYSPQTVTIDDSCQLFSLNSPGKVEEFILS